MLTPGRLGSAALTNNDLQRWLSQHVSIVSQEPTLFGRSIKRNIMYGLEGTDKEPSDEEIERIARLANAHDFIEVCAYLQHLHDTLPSIDSEF